MTFTLGGSPYEAVEDPIHGIVLRLVKAGRRKSSPGQKARPKVGDSKVKDGKTYRFNENFRWVRADKAMRQQLKGQKLSIMPEDGTSPTVKSKPRKGKSWQPSSPSAAMGSRGMAETTLRTKEKAQFKDQWLSTLEQQMRTLQQLPDISPDISLADLEQSEQMLKASLFNVGAMAGLSEAELEVDWQRIQLETQFADIHIEEL
jgi:hypothetical protein